MTTFSLVALCGAESARAADREIYADAIKVARESMWGVVTGGHADGVTIAIADGGKIVYAEGIGVADRSENRPVDTGTRFNIGSTSKVFDAVAIMLLVDDGKVALDDPVVKYIPEFRMKDPRYKDITVRMLFNHSSGLPGSTFFFGHELQKNVHERLLESLAGCNLKHAPGAMTIYCNDGFTLAEIIVERVSGMKFVDFLAKRVFKPLGMKHSGPSIGELGAKNAARHYGADGRKYPLEVVMVYGAGGLSSTASDLCRFMSSFSPYGKRILSDASVAEMLKTQHTLFSGKLRGPLMASDFAWDYSFLPDYKNKGIQVLAKSGGTTYFSTYMQTVPQYGVTVAFSMSGSSPLEPLSRKILDSVMRCKGVDIPEEKPVEKPVEGLPLPQRCLGYAGYYACGDKVAKVSFDVANKKCELSPLVCEKAPKGQEQAPPMTFVYDGEYFVCNEDRTKVYFTTADGRDYIGLHMNDYGLETLYYQKIDELPAPQKLMFDVSGKVWLIRSTEWHAMSCYMEPSVSMTYKELPGYMFFGGLKRIETPEFAAMAATAFRDQNDFAVFEKNGEKWARSGHMVFTAADCFRKLAPGVNRVIIKSEGGNEWLRVEKGAIVRFDKPGDKMRIIVMGDRGPLFDSLVDDREVYAPEGSFIYFAGAPGDLFRAVAR